MSRKAKFSVSDYTDLFELKSRVMAQSVTTTKSKAQLISGLPELTCAIRYGQRSLIIDQQVPAPSDLEADEVAILPTSVSLCGTDLGLVEKALGGQLDPQAEGRIVGHEAAGFVIGLGRGVKGWQIGDYVCLDSHYSCGVVGQRGHHSFDDCVNSGLSCDGIVGGIRGALGQDNQRLTTRDGYWNEIIVAQAGALTVKLPLSLVSQLKAPSTLESLGNIYMMVAKIEDLGFYLEPAKTLTIVVGLGATGYPMAAVAKYRGSYVVGVNPSPAKRDFALKQAVCDQAVAEIKELAGLAAKFKRVVVVVTAGDQEAHRAGFDFLTNLDDSVHKRAMIMFGLFSDPAAALDFAPKKFAKLPQRDFVFSRQEFIQDRVGVYGVCGRDLKAWHRLVKDLSAKPRAGERSLAQLLNPAQWQIGQTNHLLALMELLNQGQATVTNALAKKPALKVVANLLPAQFLKQ